MYLTEAMVLIKVMVLLVFFFNILTTKYFLYWPYLLRKTFCSFSLDKKIFIYFKQKLKQNGRNKEIQDKKETEMKRCDSNIYQRLIKKKLS